MVLNDDGPPTLPISLLSMQRALIETCPSPSWRLYQGWIPRKTNRKRNAKGASAVETTRCAGARKEQEPTLFFTPRGKQALSEGTNRDSNHILPQPYLASGSPPPFDNHTILSHRISTSVMARKQFRCRLPPC
jgi:hypothetical protein